ncbi:hypothetical protein VPH35_015395 [Triticum aestivum]|uniref:SNF2 domain-containing protein ENL1-like n=1 Tax=Triticum aestivum TaxID=4565 RepID=UPI001D019AC8|nr:SNF2 domain-containing protein ENL1-like [Triticum aestivum]
MTTLTFKMLYAHQREGLSWLWSLHCRETGGILGDDMGLGKTMQVSAFLAGLFHSGLIQRVLVIAPKTLLTHWIKELTVVGLRHMISDYSGSNLDARDFELQHAFKEGGILLTTYDIARINYRLIRGDFYNDADDEEEGKIWNYVILDEAHFIKNPKTRRAQSLFEIPCVHRIAISGTPVQNNLKEMWALFSFCCPELLGDKKEFRTLYELPINRGNDKTASNRAKHIGSNVAKELRERIKPYFLRRMKNVVSLETGLTDDKQLPKKNELIIWLKLTDCQRQLYKAFLNSELVHLASQGNPLAALTVLKKICDHPLILTKRAAEDILEGMDGMSNNQDMLMAENMAMNLADMAHADDALQAGQEVSCKLSFIMSLLRNLLEEGHHILIFSQTRKMLNLIQEAILLEGYNFLRMDGTTETSERERIVKDFKDGLGAQIFLLTTKVGGLGLTLTKAARVIVVDPAWNPSTDNQSVDRVYRIGQTKDVIVYRLMTSATVEEKIYKLQVLKGALFRAATEKKEQTRYFSKSDIRELFSLPEQGFDVSLTQKQLQEEHGQQLDVDESLREHIQFLEKQGIAGVSHHSLLFSKTEVLPMLSENDALDRGAPAKPKDERFTARTHLASNTDSEIPEEINRLLETLASTTLESRLVPDCRDKTHDLDNEMLTMWFLVCKGRDELLAATEAIC